MFLPDPAGHAPSLARFPSLCYNSPRYLSPARDPEPTDPPEVRTVPRSKATVALPDPRQALPRALLAAALLLGLLPSPALAASPRALDRLTGAQPNGVTGGAH